MSIIRTHCCDAIIDLDFNSDDVAWIDDEPWHFECAYDDGKLSLEQLESGEYVFYNNKENV